MRKLFSIAMVLVLGSCLQAAAQTLATVITNGLAEPYAVTVDDSNLYYITDSVNHRVALFDPNTGTLTNFVGRFGQQGLVDGPGIFARFYSPQGLVRVQKGFVVADTGNHALRFVSTNGTATLIAGNGTPGFVDGLGTTARFNSPAGLAVDTNGTVYIADSLNNAIRKIDQLGVVTTVASNFLRPQGVAVGENGRLYVADTGNHSIKVIEPGASTGTLIAGSDSRFSNGDIDALIALEARFTTPRAVFYQGGKTGLLVSDSGNGVVKRIYFNTTVGSYSVETFGNSRGKGLVTPVGLARDLSGNFLVTDLGSGTLWSIQVQQVVQPPVRDPVIGTVVLTNTDFFVGTKLTSVTNATFNNDVVVGILAEQGTQTYSVIGSSDTADSLPNPGSANSSPPAYNDGTFSLPHSLIDPQQPDVTIKAISTQADRRPSQVVSARFRFVVANPTIIGNNPASFSMELGTVGADLWYTTDGSTPTNSSGASKLYVPGTRLNILSGTNDVTFKVRGFKPGYYASAVTSQVFAYANLQTTLVGLDEHQVGGIGSTVIVPISLKPASRDAIRSIQFRFEVTPMDGAPPLTLPVAVESFGLRDFVPYKPGSSNLPGTFNYTTNYGNGAVASGLVVAYVSTNSGLFVSDTPATIALLAIPVPKAAAVGQRYKLSVLYPSATSDGGQSSVLLALLPDRFLTVSNISYIVGDTAVSAGYNAGTFGNGGLDNNDVNNAFYASVGVRVPFAKTDAFDAMDAFPLDGPGVVGGDGQIRYLDWQTILFRSLRLDTNNWARSWAPGGVRSTRRSGIADSTVVVTSKASTPVDTLTSSSIVWNRPARVGAVTVQNAGPGLWVDVPVYVNMLGGAKLSGFQFHVRVTGNAPALTQPLRFVRAEGMPQPVTLSGFPANETVQAWNLGSFGTPLQGSNVVGYVRMQIPSDAVKGQYYTMHFSYTDGAADSLTQYDVDTFPADIWVQSTAARAAQRVSDEWLAAFFNSNTNGLFDPLADSDGDGLTDYQEYLAGTNPRAADWRYRMSSAGFALRWFAQSPQRYQVERSLDLVTWSQVGTTISGDDQLHEFTDGGAGARLQFYRVRRSP